MKPVFEFVYTLNPHSIFHNVWEWKWIHFILFWEKLAIVGSIKVIFYARGCHFTDLHFRDAKLWNEWFIKLPCDHSKAVSSRYTTSTTYKNRQHITPKFVSQLIHPRWLLHHFHNLQNNFWWWSIHTDWKM